MSLDFPSLLSTLSSHVWAPDEPAYLLSNKWLYRYKLSARSGAPFTLPIDNSVLLLNGQLKPGLRTPQDHVLVPEATWSALVAQFSGGPAYRVTASCTDIRSIPVHLAGTSRVEMITLPASSLVSDLRAAAAAKLGVTGDSRLRSFWGQTPHELVNDRQTLESAHIYFGKDLLLEHRTAAGQWTAAGASQALPVRTSSGSLHPRGSNGMTNAGNTCYANSVLQCLLHSPLLCNLFNGKSFPGRGPVAQFADFFSAYWRTNWTVPESRITDIKRMVGSKYTDWTQQDAHEFLGDLLTRLESGGRRGRRPNVVGDGADDAEKAEELWRVAFDSNDSPILRLVTGVQSELTTCPDCGFRPSKFSTSEVLPIHLTTRCIEARVTVVPANRKKPALDCRVRVDQGCGYPGLRDAVCEEAGMAGDFVFAVSEGHSVRATARIGSGFWAFEVPDTARRFFFVAAAAEKMPIKPFLCEMGDNVRAAVLENLMEFWGTPQDEGIEVEEPELRPSAEYPWLLDGTAKVTISDALLEKGFNDDLLQPIQPAAPGGEKGVDLHECLQSLLDPVVCDEHNKWDCENCNKRVCATRKMTLWKLPQLMILHLQRFKNGFMAPKDPTFVRFPSLLDLDRYVQGAQPGSNHYCLFGIVDHLNIGSSLIGANGHYVALALNHQTGIWHLYDDAKVEAKLDEQTCRTRNAYILFYERVDPEGRAE
jgi:ubiquitin C-terminal hydrolase